MLKKRIIPCLDVENGRTVKGVNFVGLRDAGDPIELSKKYAAELADELVFLDITASIENRKTMVELVERIAREINIPFTVGGGINSINDVKRLIDSGADKVTINSSAFKNPKLIEETAKQFGSQCVVVAIDTKLINNEWMVQIHGGRTPTPISALDWAKQAEERGAGEILLTSMNNDGSKAGFALDVTRMIADAVNLPLIASGGAGKMEHFSEVFTTTKATGALAASVFHFGEITIPSLKNYLSKLNASVRCF